MNDGAVPEQGKSLRAVCLFSGGLDSTTVLYSAIREGFQVSALTVHYGQLHEREIQSARSMAEGLGIEHRILTVPMSWGGSSLTDSSMPVPVHQQAEQISRDIPPTYVPARNTVLLSLAASFAEARSAQTIFIGANAVDYSGYPDCRPEYLKAFEQALKLGTKTGDQGRPIRIKAPLVDLSKKNIVLLAHALGVPLEKTWTCYHGGQSPCGHCDACLLRAKGFYEAGLEDPLVSHAVSSH